MKPKLSVRQTFRWTVKAVFWLALVVLGLNVGNLAKQFGLDDLLVRISPTLQWLLYPALIFIGAGLALWIDGLLRRNEAGNALDDLYAEGVDNRNRLIQPLTGYVDATERELSVVNATRMRHRG